MVCIVRAARGMGQHEYLLVIHDPIANQAAGQRYRLVLDARRPISSMHQGIMQPRLNCSHISMQAAEIMHVRH